MLLLGATGHKASAATSSLKDLDKTVTVDKDNVRVYSDSTLKQSETVKNGTVYDVDGYRIIDGQKYYRVYQHGYKGYVKDTDTQDLDAKRENMEITYQKDYSRWANLFFNREKGNLNDHCYYEVKYSYTLGNGVKYYSLYRKGNNGESEWQGYVNSRAIRELKSVEEKKNIVVKNGNYNTWTNFYFEKTKGKAKKGHMYSAERYYTLGNGNKYYSLYDIKPDGTKEWAGYVNADATEDVTAYDVKDAEKQIKSTTTAWGTDGKRGEVEKGTKVIIKRYYIGNDGKKYYSIYTPSDQWLGYVSENDLMTPEKPTKPSDSSSTEKPTKPSDSSSTEKPTKPSDSESTSGSTGTSMSDSAATTVDVTTLENAIQDLKAIDKEIPASELDHDGDYNTVLSLAQDTLSAAKKGKADTKQVKLAIKQVEDFISGLTLNGDALKADVEKVTTQFSRHYMTKEQEQQAKTALQKQIDAVKKGGDKISNWDNVKSAEEAFETTLSKLDSLPTDKEGKDLQKAIDEAKKVSSMVKGHGADLFEHYAAFEDAEKNAEKVMAALKESQPGHNQATQEETAKGVSEAAGTLSQSMYDLTVNKENTTKFVQAAEKDLTSHPQAKTVFDRFVTQLKSDDSINNYEAIVTTAEQLVKELKTPTEDKKDPVVSVPGTEGKSGRALVTAVKQALDAKDANTKFANAETVKDICVNLERYYNIAFPEKQQSRKLAKGLDHNVALDRLFQDGPKAEKYIQQYAKDVNSVDSATLEEVKQNLDSDMNGLQLITDPMQEQLKTLAKEVQTLGETNNVTYQQYDKGVKQWLADKENTKALNIEKVHALYQNLDEAIQKVKEQEKKGTALPGIKAEELKDPKALAKAVSTNEYASADAQQLAKTLIAFWAAYDVNQTNPNLPGLENTKALNQAVDVDSVKGAKDLQDYAKNTKAVKDAELKQDQVALANDMAAMRVSPSKLNDALEAYAKAKGSDVKTLAESGDELVKKALQYADNGSGSTAANRGLAHFDEMVQIQKELEAATKAAQ